MKLTPQQVISISGNSRYYSQAIVRDSLPAGFYRIGPIKVGGEYIPGYAPVVVDNDHPLEIDTSVDEVLSEIKDFFTKGSVFKSLGFAHKRGYLLHGPPGCGKSSTLRLIESKFIEEFNGLVLFWDKQSNIRDFVENIRAHEPFRPIMVVTEDIDSVIVAFEEDILEFLDGHKALNNFVLMATTNNLDAIPSRIKDRPSRIDRLLEIGKPNKDVRLKYLIKIGLDEKTATDLALKTEGLSIAHLKEVVIATVCLGGDLSEVLKRVLGADMTQLEVLPDGDTFP